MYIRHDVPQARWCDVVNNLFVYATLAGVEMHQVQPDGSLVFFWSQPTPEPLMFLRCAQASDGVVWAIGKGNASGAVYLVMAGSCLKLADAGWGNNPVAIKGVPEVLTGILAYWTGPGTINTLALPPMTPGQSVAPACSPIPSPWTGTSQGILDVQGGQVLYMDAHRSRVIAGRTFYKPNEYAGVVVGQTDPPAIRCALGEYIFTALDGPGDDPHLSVMGTRFFVTAYTPMGASLAVIDTPYPAAS